MEKRFEECIEFMERNHVSDLHFTADSTCRIEGRCGQGFLLMEPKPGDEKMIPFLQYISCMDLSAFSRPQSGSFEYTYHRQVYSFRFAYLVSGNIRSGVLRMMNHREPIPMEELVIQPEKRGLFCSWLQEDNGLILIAGPTGSGKTTTAYSFMGFLKGKKLYSLEDPVEVHQKGIVQIQVNREGGLTYADGIKQLLRHDPDVIMIGEIRDEETAAMALRCALTGHLVITTIHAGSCKIALKRLSDLGIEKYDLEDVLIGIANQRLFRSSRKEGMMSLYETYDRNDLKHLMSREPFSHRTMDTEYAVALSKGWISSEK